MKEEFQMMFRLIQNITSFLCLTLLNELIYSISNQMLWNHKEWNSNTDIDNENVQNVAFIIILCIFRWSVMCKLKYSHVLERKKLYQSENQDQNHEAFL